MRVSEQEALDKVLERLRTLEQGMATLIDIAKSVPDHERRLQSLEKPREDSER